MVSTDKRETDDRLILAAGTEVKTPETTAARDYAYLQPDTGRFG